MKRKQMIISCVTMLCSITFLLVPGESGVRKARAIEPAPAEVTDLKDLAQLKEPFQRDRDTVRLIAPLSLRYAEESQAAAGELVGGGDIDARPHCVPVSHPLPPDWVGEVSARRSTY